MLACLGENPIDELHHLRIEGWYSLIVRSPALRSLRTMDGDRPVPLLQLLLYVPLDFAPAHNLLADLRPCAHPPPCRPEAYLLRRTVNRCPQLHHVEFIVIVAQVRQLEHPALDWLSYIRGRVGERHYSMDHGCETPPLCLSHR